VKCDFTDVVLVSGRMWECSEAPLADSAALDTGSWGCRRVFTVTDQPISVLAGAWSQPLYIGSGVPYTIQDGYWIATTFGIQVAQSWSQEGWQPAPPP
jgi:hypothetical protein